MESDKLFTYDRLSKFVNNYKAYITKTEKEENNTNTTNYKYYHFEQSPDGITFSNIGRFGSNIFIKNTQWKSLLYKNGIEAWKMNLAKLFNEYKESEIKHMNANCKPGLKFIMNTISNPNLMGNKQPTLDNTALYDITLNNPATSKVGIINNFDNFNTDIQQLLSIPSSSSSSYYCAPGSSPSCAPGTSPGSAPGSSPGSVPGGVPGGDDRPLLYSIDYTGLIRIEPGNYEFTTRINGNDNTNICNNCTFYIWIGDDSICEYQTDNSNLNNNNNSMSMYYPTETYVPIRIQYFFRTIPAKNTTDFHFSVFKFVNNARKDVTATSLFNCENPPLVMYSAFVSENDTDFVNDAFKCFVPFDIENGAIVVNDYKELKLFYSTFRENLNDVLDGQYNVNEYNRLSYGIIPSINTEYTIINQTSGNLPFCFSIYRINSDYRMGKTFQIKQKIDDNGTYHMNQFSDKLKGSVLEYSNSYREKSGYYPDRKSVDVKYHNNSQDVTGTKCKELCNNDVNCGHYFTYTSNGNPKCVIGSDNNFPHYNRIIPTNTHQPIDKNSSSVFLRNYQLDVSGGLNCGTLKNSNKTNAVDNTSNYSDNFKYAKYSISNEIINVPEKVGICGDKDFIEHQNDAKKILYDNAKYFNNGSWTEGFEGKPTKTTNAIDDTGDVIRNNLTNERQYAKKMDNIDEQYNDLQEQIPKLNHIKDIMTENAKYDFKGDELLHFRTHAQPDIRKKKIIDNNELYVNSELLFTLGTVTTAILIVFAIVLARD